MSNPANQPRALLRGDVVFEPLVDQWLALMVYIAPVQSALMAVRRQWQILESFLKSPRQHELAVANPRMAGGPFVGIPAARAGEVQALLERTRRENAALEAFSQAVTQLDALLDEARGLSLEPLYAQVPEALRGYVELVYNPRHSPSIRYLEGLLYQSPIHRPERQSIALSRGSDAPRPFVLSTPLLEGPGRIHLPLRFRTQALDLLFRLRHTPGSWQEAAEALGVPAGQRADFEALFEPAETGLDLEANRYQGDGVRVRFYGHATVLAESRKTSVLIDPVISYDGPNRFTYRDLPPRIDYLLITHNHADHLAPESLLQLRERVGQFVVPKSNGDGLWDASMKGMLQEMGIRNVIELGELDTLEFDGGSLTGVPFLGEHCDLPIRGKIAHLVQLEGRSLLAATDSNALEPRLYQFIRERVGEVDLLLLSTACEGGPIGYAYKTFFSKPIPRDINESRRENASDSKSAMEIVKQLKVRCYANYAMGEEPWVRHVFPISYAPESKSMREAELLMQRCREEGVLAFRARGRAELVLPSDRTQEPRLTL